MIILRQATVSMGRGDSPHMYCVLLEIVNSLVRYLSNPCQGVLVAFTGRNRGSKTLAH